MMTIVSWSAAGLARVQSNARANLLRLNMEYLG